MPPPLTVIFAMLLALLAPALATANEEYPLSYPASEQYYQLSAFVYHIEGEPDNYNYPTGVFRLIDEQGQETYAYCVDAGLGDVPGSKYRIVPLEDLTTCNDNSAQIKAIITHSYPFISAEQMISEMEANGVVLKARSIPGYEMALISAAQQALYHYTNSSYFETIDQNFSGTLPYATYQIYSDMIKDKDLYLSKHESTYSKSNNNINKDINNIINYLINLDSDTVSPTFTIKYDASIALSGSNFVLTLSNFSDDLASAKEVKVTLAQGTVAKDYSLSDFTFSPDGSSYSLIVPLGDFTPGETLTVEVSGANVYQDVVGYQSEVFTEPDPTYDQLKSQPFIGKGECRKSFEVEEQVQLPQAIKIKPVDLTIYMGGDEGYDAVVGDDDGTIVSTVNSLPTPLFYIDAPNGVNPIELVFKSTEKVPGTEIYKTWRAKLAGQDANDTDIYYLFKGNESQDDVRVCYSIGDDTFTNDTFDPSVVGDLYEDYTVSLYTGSVDTGSVSVTDDASNTYGLALGTGTLRVRAVEIGDHRPNTNPVYLVQESAPAERLEGETAAVVAEEGTTYVLNHTTVPAKPDGVGLLFDDIYDSDNGEGLREKALITQTDASLGAVPSGWTRYYQAKYLDLVDENNGNAWVKTANDERVTVYWAYPEGTSSSTSFKLLHFKGLHRDNAGGASSGYNVADIENVDPTLVRITKADVGIKFEVPSAGFSPFVLVWEKSNPTPPVTDPEEGNLVVSKVVTGEGADAQRQFTFTVTLGSKLSGTYGGMRFSSGVATFKLAHGQSVTAAGLLAGTTYVVAEAEAGQDGYETTSTGSTGTISDGKTSVATFTNAFESTPVDPGSPSTPSEPTTPTTPTNPSRPSRPALPKTGDESLPLLQLLLVGGLAAVAPVARGVLKRR